MCKLKKDGIEKSVYRGSIFEVIKQPMKAGNQKVMFEIARRSPGVRLIIIKNNKMLITREFRSELNDFDYRLPGGKVFDTYDEYKEHLSEDILPFAIRAAKLEAKEETGLLVKNITYFSTAQAGATVKWDLIYFIIDDFELNSNGQELDGRGEVINIEWKTYDEVKKMCGDGDITEDRTVGVLFKFFVKNNIL